MISALRESRYTATMPVVTQAVWARAVAPAVATAWLLGVKQRDSLGDFFKTL